MRGKQQPASEAYESPFAMTILPGKAAGKPARRPRKSDAVEAFTPPQAALTPAQFGPPPTAAPQTFAAPAPAYAAPAPAYAPQAPGFPPPMPGHAAPTDYPIDYPTAPGFPQQPHYAGGQQVGDYPPPAPGTSPQAGQPGFPPAGYAPLNFLDDPNQAPEPEKSSKRRLVLLIAVPVVLALAAGGYFVAPKLLGGGSKDGSAAVVFPASVGSLARQTGPRVDNMIKLAKAFGGKTDPLLANAQFAAYGTKLELTLSAATLPKSEDVSTPAKQAALITRINAATSNVNGKPAAISKVPTGVPGAQMSCEGESGIAGAPFSTRCVAIDGKTLLIATVDGKDAATNQATVKKLLILISH